MKIMYPINIFSPFYSEDKLKGCDNIVVACNHRQTGVDMGICSAI